ncbi:4-aminobenzoate hydroxylase [Macrolepiota fuliginosa MF-IS2]|uniref:4-aminobenzoate hydroxylase n=1 Tax=Macrolepiota fuliginosa MF-IS2 TaxID=1400762 RepID=A0A9P5XDS1_9AGAR|nr:4-aminobenzoate hydroxylase [Macrolepiota fuliginosa MF-IS2]
MSQDNNECIRVAIVGAGIVGCALAVSLNALDTDHKIAIDLYETAPELSEIGAGLNMWPRTWEIMKKIGLKDTLIPTFDHYPDLENRVVFEVRKSDQKNGYKVTDIMKEGGVLRIHRADLQRSLIKHLPLPDSGNPINSACTLHLSHRLVDYTTSDSGPTTLHFSNQPDQTCDILIGADGIKSTIRQLFLSRQPNPEDFQQYMDARWSGAVIYRGILAKDELAKVYPGHRALDHAGLMYTGKNKHTVVYPIAEKFINVVVTIHGKENDGKLWDGPWNTEVSATEFYEQFAGWDEEFQALIHCIKRPTKWAVQKLKNLPVYAKNRVFLMGDAAHAMVPHQGAGAGIGIEDAYTLAALLTHPSTTPGFTTEYIDKVASIYNAVRVPRAHSMSNGSSRQGYLYAFETEGFEQYKEGEDIPMDKMLESFREAGENWSWTATDPDDDTRKAVELLEGRA